jgi:hypothetical protein
LRTTIGCRPSLQHEAGLRQRTFGGVDQQQHPVHHLQGSLDLATEIGVARGVDDIDLDALMPDRCVLGEDRDATLTLEIARVHDPFGNPLVRAEGAALPQHGVHQRRFAVVDVGNDGQISEFGHTGDPLRSANAARCCNTWRPSGQLKTLEFKELRKEIQGSRQQHTPAGLRNLRIH